ncbi:MAG: TonB-dependent receptor [Clostridium sp.]|nr:TonB-dependent receptor [Prevotella sp.]MCM1429441.1 TonB-dependent receptor [Clostridium sp.]MCM1475524.1 TonB-dependent receptor [Muribaculaceae bacterium]
MKKLTLVIILTIISLHCIAADISFSGSVIDGSTSEPLPYAAVLLMPGNHSAMTDDNGRFSMRVPAGKYTIKVSYLGYDNLSTPLSLTASVRRTIKLKPKTNMLQEVTVTAKESDGLTSSSRIDRDAMNHLQPTSFTDLLELLPGNISQNPDMGHANTINLRETGNLSATGAKTSNDDYAISSLGTLFMVDGAPINGDANLQGVGIASDSPTDARAITNKGVDMRSISTDNIQSVEIVRGIPSAEYGNLTSGIVKITRINKSTPLSFRFKVDEYSKLFSAGKGFGLGESPWVLNADLGFLDSKSDPRNNLENYKRLTGSLRLTMRTQGTGFNQNLNIGMDYTGSFDNTKVDPDLSYLKVDEYKSSYNRMALTTDYSFLFNRHMIFDDFNVNASLSYQIDRLKRRKQVAPQRASVAPTTMSPGEHQGEYLLGEYIADYESDGRPLNFFFKARAAGQQSAGLMNNQYKVGLEWTLSKNYGRGQIYDLTRPISASWTSRPRAFRDIPALHVLSFFVEDRMTLSLPTSTLSLQLGLRSIQLPHLNKKYYLAGRQYLDPRLNAAWDFKLGGDRDVPVLTLAGGYGLTTKMPTIDYLYPQEHYNDIIELNYYDVNDPAHNSLILLRTYVDDAVNYDLKPARNHKWEVRLALAWKGNRLSVTYFQERMNDGFRYQTIYNSYDYKKYDGSGINSSTLTGPPSIADIPVKDAKILDGYRMATNGTRIYKQGIEWQINTARWKPVCTSLIVTGAWFRSTYSNSQMLYSSVSDVYDGIPVSDRYVGLYNYRDGRINEQVNTNFMFDTQIPRWGLVITTTLQCMWQVKTTRIPINGIPDYYLDAADGELHPYNAEILDDPALQYLVKTYNEDSFRPYKIPFAGYLNLKATKQLGKHFRIALFVNRILDWLPSYRSNGLLVRRSANPYFGMELNVTI